MKITTKTGRTFTRAGRVLLAGCLTLSTIVVGTTALGGSSAQATPLPVEPPEWANGSAAQTFGAGSYIIDMGAGGTTKPNALRPYGIVYDLIVNKQIPVSWVIAANKTISGPAGSPPAAGTISADFSATVQVDRLGGAVSKTYRSSAFVIPAEFVTPAVDALVDNAQFGSTTVVDKATTSFSAPVFVTLKYWPRTVLDAQNGSLAIPYFTNAGIANAAAPAAPRAYYFKSPSQLNNCDDLYVMPHADPTWVTHQNLKAFNNQGGYIWAGCHAVSVLENIVDPSSPGSPAMNFLSNAGLIPFGSHAGGTPPYSYSSNASDPIMQFLGAVDAAQQNGSEQIDIPKQGVGQGWRPTTKRVVWDPTQANSSGAAGFEASTVTYGRGFGNPTNGLVMYEASHSLNKGTVGDAPAQRAFFNFLLLNGVERAPTLSINGLPASMIAGQTYPVSASITGGSPSYNYTWSASCTGTFAQATGTVTTDPGTIATTFTPAANVNGNCNLRVTVTDSCGRIVFDAKNVVVSAPVDVQITKVANKAAVPVNGTYAYTLTVKNNGPGTATNLVVTDTLPPGVVFQNSVPATVPVGQVLTYNFASLLSGSTQTITVNVQAPGTAGPVVNNATVAAAEADPVPSNNSASATTPIINSNFTVVKSASPSTVPAGGGSVAFTYVVTNTGDNAISGVTINDSPTCTMSGPTGDANANANFDVGEVWTYSCSRTVNGATPDVVDGTFPTDGDVNTKQDIVTVSGTDSGGNVVTRTAAATVTLSNPSISVTKTLSPNTQRPAVGALAVYDITVTNTGNVTLTNVSTSDAWLGTCSVASIPNLAPGATYTYTCNATVVGGAPATIASDDFPDTGNDLNAFNDGSGWGSTSWTKTGGFGNGDVSVVNVAIASPQGNPGVRFNKENKSLDRGIDLSGQSSVDVSFSYLRSAPFNNNSKVLELQAWNNTTSAYDTIASITGTNVNTADASWSTFGPITINLAKYLTANSRIRINYPSGAGGDDDVWIDAVSISGSTTPENSISASGTAITGGPAVNASDTEPTPLGSPKLAITKSADVTKLHLGDTINYTVSVTNNDTVQHTGLAVTDTFPTGLTLGGVTVQIPPAGAVACGGCTLVGNQLNLAPAGTSTIDAGQTLTWVITATVTAPPADGQQFPNTVQVTSAQQTAPVLDAVSTPYRNNNYTITKTASPTQVNGSGSVTYTMVVTNTGNTDLTPNTGLDDPSCAPLTGPTGDTAPLGVLQQSETWTYTCTTTVTTPANDTSPDSVPNTVTGTFDDPDGVPVVKTGTANVTVYHPSISVAASPATATIVTGGTVPYVYTLTNTGDTPVAGPAVTAVNCSPVVYSIGDTDLDGVLDTGEVWTYTCTTSAINANQVGQNVGATGTDQVFGSPLTASTTVDVTVVSPKLSITKVADNTLDANPAAASITVPVSNAITYTYSVQNTGDTPLTSVLVTDDKCAPVTGPTAGDAGTIGTLDVGETWTMTCVKGALSATTTNTAGVSAAYNQGPLATGTVAAGPVTATVTVLAPELVLTKSASSQYVKVGSSVTYTYDVKNTGQTAFPAANFTATDDTCSPLGFVTGDSAPLNSLDPGETWTYTCDAVVTTDTLNTFDLKGPGGVGNSFNDALGNSYDSPPAVEQVFVINPVLTITKTAQSSIDGPGQNIQALPGDAITYTISVTATAPGVPTPSLSALQIVVSDPMCSPVYQSGDTDTNGNIDPGETWIYTCVVPSIPAGPTVTNTVEVIGTPVNRQLTILGDPIDPNDGLTAQILNDTADVTPGTPEISLDKVVTSGNYAAVNDIVTYDFVITNSGDVPVYAPFSVDDPLLTNESCPNTPVVLNPTESITCTGSYQVDQLDLDAGAVINIADASAASSDGGPADLTAQDGATTVGDQTPGLTVLKSAVETEYSAVGDQIHYRYELQNNGNVTLSAPFAVTDSLGFPVSCSGAPASLAPGDSYQYCTGTYSVVQSDLDAGSITNVATATAQDPNGDPVTDTDNHTLDGLQTPELTLTKGGPATFNSKNENIVYSFLLENTGNVTLLPPFAVSDPLVTSVICPQPATLPPNASLLCIGTYTSTQLDVDRGSVDNTATATADFPAGTPLAPSAPSTWTVDALQDPALSIDKTADVSTFDHVGQVITYTFTLKNTGDTTLFGPFTVTDPMFPGSPFTCLAAPSSLAPGDSTSCTATYTVTLVDLNAGSVLNTATAGGFLPDSTGTAPSTTPVTSPPDSATVAAVQKPALNVVKTLDAATPTFDSVGDTVTFDFTVTNPVTANVSLTGPFTFNDSLGLTPLCTGEPVPPATLDPGDSFTCTADYLVTQADLDAGFVENSVTVSALDPEGNPVTSPPSAVSAPADQAASLSLAKDADQGSSFTQAGDTITFTFTITNDGNVTVSGPFTVTDPTLGGVVDCTAAAGSLAPTASTTCTATYTVTQTDVNKGFVFNTAQATGVDPQGDPVVSPPASETVPGLPVTELTLDKVSLEASFTTAGQPLNYEFLLTNTGTTTLFPPFAVADDLLAPGNVSCPQPSSLPPGGSITCTGSYVTTQADIDAGAVINQATASALPSDDTGLAGDPLATPVTSAPDTNTVLGVQDPVLTLVKSGPATFSSTGSITFTFDVTNTGDVTLFGPFTITDSLIGNLTCLAAPSSLAPGDSTSCQASYSATQLDLDRGKVVNTATARGFAPDSTGLAPDPNAPVDSPPSTWTVTAVQQPELTLDKAKVGSPTFTAVPEALQYTYTLTNTGNVTLFAPFSVTDSLGIVPACPSIVALAPGDSTTCTATYTTVPADAGAGFVYNSATGRGYAPDSTGAAPNLSAPIFSDPDTVTVPLLAATLSGNVFDDVNGNGVQDALEPGIPGVSVRLYGPGNVLVATVVTDANGDYLFTGILAGTYRIVETQPVGYLDGNDLIGSNGGTNAPTDTIASVTLAPGDNATDYAFIEYQPSSFSGAAYVDVDGNGSRQPGEPGIAGVTVTLTGTDADGNPVNTSTVTDANGDFTFTNLRPGTYHVTETQPAGYGDGADDPGIPGGSLTGPDTIDFTLDGGVTATGALFGELASTMSGRVFLDTAKNAFDNGLFTDPGIAGVQVTLQGVDVAGDAVLVTVTTDADGVFTFEGLRAGTYSISEVQPAYYIDGADIVGTAGGVANPNDVISLVTLGANTVESDYAFAEQFGSLSGSAYVDTNNDGIRQPGEPGLAGIQINLTGTDVFGNPVNRAVDTDVDGNYSFANVAPADTDGYSLSEPTQPAGYADGLDTAGTAGGVVLPPNGDTISHVDPGTTNATGYLFGERGGSLAGLVWADRNGDNLPDPGEGIAGVTVTLTDPLDPTFLRTVVTGPDGTYVFPNLPASTYTLTETQPAGYGDGPDTPGSAAGVVGPNDTITGITMSAGLNATGYFFQEALGTLTGVVYEDLDGNGVRDPGEPGISGVPVTISGSTEAGVAVGPTTVLTDGNGDYTFPNLLAGTYLISETQPAPYADGAEQIGTPGNGVLVAPDSITSITFAGGETLADYNFGELLGAISGRVYDDKNGNGVLDLGEPGIAGVTVTITGNDVNGPVNRFVVTDGSGSYSIGDLLAGTYTLTETQPGGFFDFRDTAGTLGGTAALPTSDAIVGIVLSGAANVGTGYNFGELAPASLSGVVFDDKNSNTTNELGEELAGVTVTLTGTDINGNPVTVVTATDGTGTYTFSNLTPGTYSITETQPTGYGDGPDTPGSAGGVSTPTDTIANVTVDSGTVATGYQFAETTGSITGHVYSDTNANGVRDPGEPGIPGVKVTLSGTDVNGAIVPVDATTDGTGQYVFTNLLTGTYSLLETQPPVLLDGADHVGTAGGLTVAPDTINTVGLTAGTGATGYDFGEFTPASFTGTVFDDRNNNTVIDSTEGIPGVTVTLTGTDAQGNPVLLTTTTNGSGVFTFTNVPPGTYSITETQPSGYGDGADTPGTNGGAPVPSDTITGILVKPGDPVAGYTFAEHRGSLSGSVYLDADADGIRDAGEVGIAGIAVTLTGTDVNGAIAPVTVNTDANGDYVFPNLLAGTYTVTEGTVPGTYVDGKEHVGTSGGTLANDLISGIALGAGLSATAYQFGEYLPNSISGYVYSDQNGNGAKDPGEPGIQGVTVTLTGTDIDGNVVNRPAVSDASGAYVFSNVAPSSPAGYTLTETQPTGYGDGTETAGTNGGNLSVNDVISGIVTTTGNTASGYLFAERTSSISGSVFLDLDSDGARDPGELGLSNVKVTLVRTDIPNQPGVDVFTDANGNYVFANLPAGTYSITETQPNGYTDWKDAVGSAGGALSAPDSIITIPLGGGVQATGYTFSEISLGSITGFVFDDRNSNGAKDPSEPGLSGVTIDLTGTDAAGNPVTRTTTTDGTGAYSFTNMPPGTYQVSEPTQPSGYGDGVETPGSAGGNVSENDKIKAVVLGPGQIAGGYLFAELSSEVSGVVFNDLNGNGTRDAGEPGLTGVTVQLTGLDLDSNPVNLTTLTDSLGRFVFDGVKQGTYTITETQPGGFLDWVETPGSAGGTTAPPPGDTISSIFVGAGADSTGNFFSEIKAASFSGIVYNDLNANGVRDGGEPGIQGVTVALSGTDTLGNPIGPLYAVTDPQGIYLFTNLLPGTYSVTELPPPNYLDGKDTVGNKGGVKIPTDTIDLISIKPNDVATGYLFGEVSPSTLSGFVFVDKNNNGNKDPGEIGIENAQVVLSGVDFQGNLVNKVAISDATGAYTFTGVPPSNVTGYTITESQPTDYGDGKDKAGSKGGVLVGPDSISTIPILPGDALTGYLFGERQGSISGHVWNDLDADGAREFGEPAIFNVTVTLTGTDNLGNPVNKVTTTDANGAYTFVDVPAGTYTLTETQPASFLDGADNVGSAGGFLIAPDTITDVTLDGGEQATGYEFGEVKASTLSGKVFQDDNANLAKEPGEPGLSGVTLHLTGLDFQGNAVDLVTVTDGTGSYTFTGLPPSNQTGYTVSEEQPYGFGDGPDKAGTKGGIPSEPDTIGVIPIRPNENATGYLFTERRGSLSGSVFHDLDGDGVRDPGEPGLQNVAINLTGTDVNGTEVNRTVLTDASGNYTFDKLLDGTYAVVEPVQPANYLDWAEHAGTVGGDTSVNETIKEIVIVGGPNATGYTFAEVRPASLSGLVYLDFDEDTQHDPIEPGLGGVEVTLTGTDGLGNPIIPIVVLTAADGTYTFPNLLPGNYTVTETQPNGYKDLSEASGSAGGDITDANTIKNINLKSGLQATGYLFGEDPAAIAGTVFDDRDADGLQGPSDPGIAGVKVTLTGTDIDGNPVDRTTTTDALGHYLFDGLPAGEYSITETQPLGYLDWVDTVGTAGGALVPTDTINQITLDRGEDSSGYNYAEVKPSSLDGTAYEDLDANGQYDVGEPLLLGVKVTLSGFDLLGNPIGPIVKYTDINGYYKFDDLLPGVYKLVEETPDGYLDGIDTVGSKGGTKEQPDTIKDILLMPDSHGVGYNWGEVKPSSLSGLVFLDVDAQDGVPNNGELGIGGVTVRLVGTDFQGNAVNLTTTTAPDGTFSFTNLAPGQYSLIETQPEEYQDWVDTPGTKGGVAVPTDTIADIVLKSGDDGINYWFAELGGEIPNTH